MSTIVLILSVLTTIVYARKPAPFPKIDNSKGTITFAGAPGDPPAGINPNAEAGQQEAFWIHTELNADHADWNQWHYIGYKFDRHDDIAVMRFKLVDGPIKIKMDTFLFKSLYNGQGERKMIVVGGAKPQFARLDYMNYNDEGYQYQQSMYGVYDYNGYEGYNIFNKILPLIVIGLLMIGCICVGTVVCAG
eukprot:105697_1